MKFPRRFYLVLFTVLGGITIMAAYAVGTTENITLPWSLFDTGSSKTVLEVDTSDNLVLPSTSITNIGPGNIGIGNVNTGYYGDGTNLAARLPSSSGSFFVQASNGASLLQFSQQGSGTSSYMDLTGYVHLWGKTNPSYSNQGAYLNWNQLNGGGTGETDFVNNQGGGSGGFAFQNTPNGTHLATLAFISGGGNVGIGTTTPAQKLDVAGNIRLSGNIVSSNAGAMSVTAPNGLCLGNC